MRCPLGRRSGARALCASGRHGTKVGRRKRDGVVQTRRAVFRERERNWVFSTISESEKVIEGRESFGKWRGGSIKWV